MRLAPVRDHELAGDVLDGPDVSSQLIERDASDVLRLKPGRVAQRAWRQAVALSDLAQGPAKKMEKQQADVLSPLA